MPYASHEARKRVQREAQARRRAAARAATGNEGLTSTPINPAVASILPPLPPPSRADLDLAGTAITCPRMPHEDDPHYHRRLQDKWKMIRAILEGG